MLPQEGLLIVNPSGGVMVQHVRTESRVWEVLAFKSCGIMICMGAALDTEKAALRYPRALSKFTGLKA